MKKTIVIIGAGPGLGYLKKTPVNSGVRFIKSLQSITSNKFKHFL